MRRSLTKNHNDAIGKSETYRDCAAASRKANIYGVPRATIAIRSPFGLIAMRVMPFSPASLKSPISSQFFPRRGTNENTFESFAINSLPEGSHA